MTSKDFNEFLKLSSSKSYIYENLDQRNQKRVSQFSKRKKALSPDSNMIRTNDKTKNKNKNKKNKNSKEIINIFNLIIKIFCLIIWMLFEFILWFNKYNNELDINEKALKNKDNDQKPEINESNRIIDNLKDINIIKNNNLKNSNNKNISNFQKESNNIFDYHLNQNEFSQKYLSSLNSGNSFIKLGNNLKTKIKIQNNEFTESYILALGLDEQNYNKYKYQNLENINIIKEEKENNEDLNEKILKKAKFLNKFKFNKVKKKKINLFKDKNIIKINNNNNNINKNSLLLNTVNEFYKSKNKKQKIIKLKIDNYDHNFAIMNIERRNKSKK